MNDYWKSMEIGNDGRSVAIITNGMCIPSWGDDYWKLLLIISCILAHVNMQDVVRSRGRHTAYRPLAKIGGGTLENSGGWRGENHAPAGSSWNPKMTPNYMETLVKPVVSGGFGDSVDG